MFHFIGRCPKQSLSEVMTVLALVFVSMVHLCIVIYKDGLLNLVASRTDEQNKIYSNTSMDCIDSHRYE